jgi:phosphate/sulfate permease
LIAAIIWNLGTWSFGLPASSSHTLIGSVIGVGVANALLRGRDGTSGVDWNQAISIGKALLFSPIFGFVLAGILLLAIKFIIRNKELFSEPKGNQPPPWWIRGILVLTCTLVSFFHGSNDGQKGMGLIMADLDRHGTDGLRAQPQHAGESGGSVSGQFAGGERRDWHQSCRLQCARGSAASGDRLRCAASDQ